jgi:SAM-dependent methyltransferase/uncharacterized protein YbaR (Trm112 family)
LKKDFLDKLSCPYCGVSLKRESVLRETSSSIESGTLRCECDTYAIIEGILVLKAAGKDHAVHLLSQAREREALLALLEVNPFPKRAMLGTIVEQAQRFYYARMGKLLTLYRDWALGEALDKEDFSFCDTLSIWTSGSWGDYLKTRFSHPSFIASSALFSIVRSAPQAVLEVGCGAGHTTFALSKHVDARKIVAVDSRFINVYSAKRFFVNEATFVCHDVNMPLPFADEFFDVIVSADALHCVKVKRLLIREFARTLERNGVILVPHLHNLEAHTGNPLIALSLYGYEQLFGENYLINMVSEEKVLNDVLLDNALNLARSHSSEVLSSAEAISLVAAKDTGFFVRHREVCGSDARSATRIVINPEYDSYETDEGMILRKESSYHTREEGYQLPATYLPGECVITPELHQWLLSDRHPRDLPIPLVAEAEDLLQRFVLLDVPRNYL